MTKEEALAKFNRISNDPRQAQMFVKDLLDGKLIEAGTKSYKHQITVKRGTSSGLYFEFYSSNSTAATSLSELVTLLKIPNFSSITFYTVASMGNNSFIIGVDVGKYGAEICKARVMTLADNVFSLTLEDVEFLRDTVTEV